MTDVASATPGLVVLNASEQCSSTVLASVPASPFLALVPALLPPVTDDKAYAEKQKTKKEKNNQTNKKQPSFFPKLL